MVTTTEFEIKGTGKKIIASAVEGPDGQWSIGLKNRGQKNFYYVSKSLSADEMTTIMNAVVSIGTSKHFFKNKKINRMIIIRYLKSLIICEDTST